MYWLLVLLDPSLAYPPPSTLGRFPDWPTVCTQIDRCKEHIERLSDCRRLHGYSDGLWDGASQETAFRLRWWRQLSLCHQCEREVGLLTRRLQRLRELSGYAPFLNGWHPDHLPAPPTPMPRAEPANAAGR